MALGPTGHPAPHAPQLATSLAVAVSQPFPMSSSQSPQPLAHASAQLPPAQLASALDALGHALPHPPQWSGSVEVRTQLEPHCIPTVHAAPQPYPEPARSLQSGSGSAHETPHIPHAVGTESGASHPVDAIRSQSPNPALQVRRQLPSTHATVALLTPVTHEVLHAPQRARLLERSSSHPFAGSPSQSPKSGRHPSAWHVPVAQDVTAPGRSQRSPQRPQWASSRSMDSQPFAASPSQSA
jgi:hypothetical protein